MDKLVNSIITNLKAGLPDLVVFLGRVRSIDKAALNQGVIFVCPESSIIEAVTTGIRDKETNRVCIVLAKSVQDLNYQNAESVTGIDYMMRVMDGRNDDRSPLSNTIRTIVRQNFKTWGLRQPRVTITYDSKDPLYTSEAVVTSRLEFTVEDINNQLLN